MGFDATISHMAQAPPNPDTAISMEPKNKTSRREMAERREIDERDIDQLLKALSDRQIADLFGLSEAEVSNLRRSRQPKLPAPPSGTKEP